MESCQICKFGIRPKLTTRNYPKWSSLIIDHLREHPELLPYLYSLPPYFDWTYVLNLIDFLCNSMSKESFPPFSLGTFPYEYWMSLWKYYGDPSDPYSLVKILPPVTLAMVSSTSDEIIPLALVAPTDPILATDTLDSVQ